MFLPFPGTSQEVSLILDDKLAFKICNILGCFLLAVQMNCCCINSKPAECLYLLIICDGICHEACISCLFHVTVKKHHRSSHHLPCKQFLYLLVVLQMVKSLEIDNGHFRSYCPTDEDGLLKCTSASHFP